MKIVIELSREDLVAALNASTAGSTVRAEVKADTIVKERVETKPTKPAKAKKIEVESEDFDEEEEEAKPTKAAKKTKPAKAAPVVEEDESEEDEEAEEAEESEEDEEAEESDEDEFITGEDLNKLKKALNAHKSAQGGKPKKTLEILRKYAPGGSEKVKPDALPKLLKALKV